MITNEQGRPILPLAVVLGIIWRDNEKFDWSRAPTENERALLFAYFKGLNNVRKVAFVNNILFDGWVFKCGQLVANFLDLISDEKGRWWLDVVIGTHYEFYTFKEAKPKRKTRSPKEEMDELPF